MNIVYCFNDNKNKEDTEQIKLLFTSLLSLIINNINITVYIIYLDFNKKNLKLFNTFFKDNLSNIHLIKFPKKYYNELNFMIEQSIPTNKGTFLRLFIGELLPISIKKIIYLDTDTIINKPLIDLYNKNFNGKYLQVVLDNNKLFSIKKEKELNLIKNTYFNAGIIFFNLEIIRNNLLQKSLEVFKKHKNLFADQDALNIIYNKSIQLISNNYNCIVNEEYYKKAIIIHYAARGKILKIRPAIIHKKYKNLYWNFLDKTPFKGYRPRIKLLHLLTYVIYKLIPKSVLLKLNNLHYYKKIMNYISKLILSQK